MKLRSISLVPIKSSIFSALRNLEIALEHLSTYSIQMNQEEPARAFVLISN